MLIDDLSGAELRARLIQRGVTVDEACGLVARRDHPKEYALIQKLLLR